MPRNLFLITVLKLITVDEMGIDEFEEEYQLSFHGTFCNVYLGVGVPMLVKKRFRKAMNRNWSNQKANPALKTKTVNK